MNRASRQLSAAGAIFKRDLLLFASHRTRPVTTLFTTGVTLTLFYYVSRLVHARSVGDPNAYFAYVVVGLVIFGVLVSSLSTPVATVRAELQTATFERLVLSPFGAVRSVASLVLFPLAMAFATGVLSLAFAVTVFGVRLHWATVPLAAPTAVLAALSFAPFGVAMCAGVALFKQTNAGATFVMAAFSLLAGVYFPVSLLPAWIRWASDVQPFTPAVDLLRHLLLATPLRASAATDLVKLFGFALVAQPLALVLLAGAVRRSRRLGTIIEY